MLIRFVPGYCLGWLFFIFAGSLLFPESGVAQLMITPSVEMELDSEALVFADTANFSRDPNGSSYRMEPIVTYGGFQFATWYHAGPGTGEAAEENIYIARRRLTGDTWDIRDTGQQMINGDTPGSEDSHNIISMGISGDGRIHLAYDMHSNGHDLRYLSSQAGRATTSDANWNNPNFTVFNSERSSLNPSSNTLSNITYPRFINNNDDMLFTYRSGGSGNGSIRLARYDHDGTSVSTRWVDANGNQPVNLTDTIISGAGTYNYIDRMGTTTTADDVPAFSTSRNAYLNGVDVGPDGDIHMTWTWRESASGPNHDINYAYSEDNGTTWRNNAGQSLGSTISIDSPGIVIESLDQYQAIANQQGQAVDSEGGVHALMYHRRQDAGFEWEGGDGNFFTGDSAYFHYYRDPVSLLWSDTMLPTDRVVGSRPSIGFDSENNLYAAYLTRASGNDILRIVGAEKLPSGGYDDWVVLTEDSRDWAGTPFLDQTRLSNDDVLSVYLQEDTDLAGRTGTSLRVLEFDVVLPVTVPEPSSLAFLGVLSASLIARRRKCTV